MCQGKCLKGVFISFDRFPPIIPITLTPQLTITCTVIRNEGMNAGTCTHTHTHTNNTHTFQPWPAPTSQWPSQSSVLTPMELISHGSTVHLLPQTLGCSHVMLTQNTITSACLHCSCGAIKKDKDLKMSGGMRRIISEIQC